MSEDASDDALLAGDFASGLFPGAVFVLLGEHDIFVCLGNVVYGVSRSQLRSVVAIADFRNK